MTLSYYPEFLTATILKWQHLLANDHFKKIVTDALQWLVQQNRCNVYAFVIMPNHIHLMWKIADNCKREDVQGALFSFTAHEFKKYLKNHDPALLNKHYVNDADRKYQFWERNPLYKECRTDKFFMQKFNYIHNNPCQPHWDLVSLPEDYYWSSASYYQPEATGFKFPWISHFMDR
ncbi:MAG: transposase [Bacteroidetes bacterium]|nr:transposase [Bacteroidota bacterium]MBS1632011.1 transposase [Bacteroidota bacterium]